MANKYLAKLLKPQLPLTSTFLDIKGNFLHTSPALFKVTAGKVKISPRGDKPVTYEDSLPPPQIAHTKSWNSWNTSTINGGHKCWEIATDDLFIRKFMNGTFRKSILTKVVIKRQYNMIRVAAIVKPINPPSRMGFLIGYTEELLSHWLQCVVKLELQILNDSNDLTFKFI